MSPGTGTWRAGERLLGKLPQRKSGAHQDATQSFFCKYPPKMEKIGGGSSCRAKHTPKLPGFTGTASQGAYPSAAPHPEALLHHYPFLPGMLLKPPASLCRTAMDRPSHSPPCHDGDELLRGSGGNKPHRNVGDKIPWSRGEGSRPPPPALAPSIVIFFYSFFPHNGTARFTLNKPTTNSHCYK